MQKDKYMVHEFNIGIIFNTLQNIPLTLNFGEFCKVLEMTNIVFIYHILIILYESFMVELLRKVEITPFKIVFFWWNFFSKFMVYRFMTLWTRSGFLDVFQMDIYMARVRVHARTCMHKTQKIEL